MIYGLAGMAGAGKNTVGAMIQQIKNIPSLAFANPLKDAIAAIFGWPRHLLEGDSNESRIWRDMRDDYWSECLGREITPRIAMQLVGTDVLRNVLSDKLWIYSMEKQLRMLGSAVVTDCRFPNEFACVAKYNGVTIRVCKTAEDPEWLGIAALAVEGHKPSQDRMSELGFHPSEYSWATWNFDHVIVNDGDFHQLMVKVKGIVSQYP